MTEVTDDAVIHQLARSEAWNMVGTVQAQSDITSEELRRWLSGEIRHEPFEAFQSLVCSAKPNTLLDVGCGCAHYRQVLLSTRPRCRYTGVDSSSGMIRQAVFNAHGCELTLADASERLPFDDRSFDLVVEGCVIIHELNWRAVLRECCRLADSHVMLHRTPYSTDCRTRYYRHVAYCAECLAIHYARHEIQSEMEGNGFRRTREITLPCEHFYRMSSSLWVRSDHGRNGDTDEGGKSASPGTAGSRVGAIARNGSPTARRKCA